MKNQYNILLTVLVSLLLSSCLTKEQKAEKMIASIDQKCPFIMNGTRFDHFKKVDERMAEMQLTFLNTTTDDFGDMTSAMETSFKTILLQVFQIDNSYSLLKDANFSVHCIIYASNGQDKLMDFIITPDEYSQINELNSAYKIDKNKSEQDNVSAMINLMVDAMKPHLPEVDAETGIETSDVYFKDMTFTTVIMYPDDIINEFETSFGAEGVTESIRELMLYTIRTNPSMRSVAEHQINIEFIINRKNGEVYTKFILPPSEVLADENINLQ